MTRKVTSMSYMSQRERLIRLASRLKLSFPPGISDGGLVDLINAAPANDRQLLIVNEFLRPLGRRVPRDMTFGYATQVISRDMEVVNEQAVQSLRLVEGAVRLWNGEYFCVVRLYGSALLHMVGLQVVTLHRSRGAKRARVSAKHPKEKGKEIKVNPVNMLFVSTAVDLQAWQPGQVYGPTRVSPDQPLF